MPLTRKQAGATEDKLMATKQVTDNAISCHGSDISSKSHARIARFKLLKAQIRERLVEQELELEIQEIVARRRRELLLAKIKTEMAKIDVAVEEQQRIKEEAEQNKRSQIDRYKRPCDLPRLEVTEPPDKNEEILLSETKARSGSGTNA
ncbi:unnamed protein product [Echinostoma caproni]|uniref:BMERB domain-containing protein n=1 Tax=Echinostoma caproni TaxID=27848 RepID=A0A183AE09_9TREM|nr:unnamed protein product [Echinostoma caproni]